MGIKMQAIKISVDKLIERIRVAEQQQQGKNDEIKLKAGVALAEKRAQARKYCDELERTTVEDFMANNYHFREALSTESFQKVIHMLEMCPDEVISVSPDSDLAKYI